MAKMEQKQAALKNLIETVLASPSKKKKKKKDEADSAVDKACEEDED